MRGLGLRTKLKLTYLILNRVVTMLSALSSSGNNIAQSTLSSPTASSGSPSSSFEPSPPRPRSLECDTNDPNIIFGASGGINKLQAWYVMYEVVLNSINLSRSNCFGDDVDRKKKGRVVKVIENMRRVVAKDDKLYLRASCVPNGAGSKEEFEQRDAFLKKTAEVAKEAVEKIVAERIPLWNKRHEKQRTTKGQSREVGAIVSLLEKTDAAFSALNSKAVNQFFASVPKAKKQRTTNNT